MPFPGRPGFRRGVEPLLGVASSVDSPLVELARGDLVGDSRGDASGET